MDRDAAARLVEEQPAQRVVAREVLHLLEDRLTRRRLHPSMTTLPISPPAWQPTTVRVRAARKAASVYDPRLHPPPAEVLGHGDHELVVTLLEREIDRVVPADAAEEAVVA